jgi:Tfp pilus assembly protein PilN
MRAVNLIPADERRGSGSGGSGIGSYIVLGVLALVVALSAGFALANRSLDRSRHELASVEARAQSAEAAAQQLASYTSFSALREKRSDTVRSLASSRFDWSRTLHEVARTIPSNAWLTSLRGTVTPTTQLGGGANDPLRASLPGPALEILGCTVGQDDVADVISSLRRVNGVQRVSLSSSEKLQQTSGGSDAATGGDDDCRHGNVRYPQFSMTLFFAAPSGGAAQGTTP